VAASDPGMTDPADPTEPDTPEPDDATPSKDRRGRFTWHEGDLEVNYDPENEANGNS
jgi:hypothetical protein